MRITLILLLLFSFLNSCFTQDAKIISKKKIQLETHPDYDQRFVDRFDFISNVDFYEIYYTSDGLKIEAFAAIPKKEGKHPVIIFNRGGNRDFGALSLFPPKNPSARKLPAVYFLGKLANEGYLVIGSNYRGGGNSEGKDEFGGKDVNDVLNLIEVVKEMTEADTSKIGMYGWSRGGTMTYLALPQTNNIKAAVVGGAKSDYTKIDRPEMENGVYAELIPDYWKNKSEELKKRSAVQFADKFSKEVPILLLHGNADWRVKSTQSLRLALEFEKHRIPYRLKIFEGADHGIREHREEVHQEVISWFDRFLKNEEPAPNMDFHGN